MTARIYAPRMVWAPMSGQHASSATAALARVLSAWEHTPYGSGQRYIQRAADCFGAVFGVVDMLDGLGRAQYPGMPQDAGTHDRKGTVRALRELVRRYSPYTKVEALEGGIYRVEPGDIIITGEPGGGPGHVEMVGSRKNELWHALPGPGFHQGGWSLFSHQVLFAIYRVGNKEMWS